MVMYLCTVWYVKDFLEGKEMEQELQKDLRGADLRGANLRYADLTGADLRCADLRGTDLSYADIRGADLTDACLVGVDVPGVVYDDFTADIVTVGRDRFFRWVAKTFGTGDEAKTIAASDEADPEDAAYHAGLKRRAEMLAEIAASDAKYITYGDGDLGIPVSKADALDDIASMDPLSIGDGTWYPCSGPVSDEAKEIVARGGYEAAVSLMDDGIRECLHAELAPCSDAAFLAAYMAAHKAAFGKDFVVA